MKKQVFFLALSASLTLFFVSCKKDNVATADFEGIQELVAENPERLYVNEELGVANQYIIMLKESYLRPAILDELPEASRPTTAEDRNANQRQMVEAEVQRFIAEVDIPQEKVSAVFGHLISGFTAELTKAQLILLLNDPRVESIEQDMEVTVDDVLETNDTQAVDRAQTTPCGITRHGGAGNGSGSSKWIWIVDSGIQTSHPDLNVITNSPYARSFVGGSFQDCNGHGTHVAGTAAAKNNSFGVVGMSAGAWVVPIKIMDGCGSTYYNSKLLSALNHIASCDEPGDVVNLSIGGYYGSGCNTSSPLKSAIENLGKSGTWVVIAAGNNSAFAGNYQPACINGTKILTIANMTCQGAWNSTSNYNLPLVGPTIDWIGVGTNVYSTYKGSSYATMSGTSMAAPHVAGIVHYRQANPIQNGSVTNNLSVYKVASRI